MWGFEGLGSPLVFVVVIFVAVGFGAGQLFEEVGVLDGGGDFVVSAGPFAEVEDAAAVAAEGEVFAVDEDNIAAGRAEEGFRHCRFDCKSLGRG